ncbi:glycosyltransferase family 2 protein [Marinobacterium rhizophilum]|uniref:Glycosyltransferase family 2 protein n=1 Tax=Marinobacterium rhizophilum TaxID=420402 RepID=A0ABY5HSQ3_9GAMM|nr:glycosyltransferase family 2 protein [Marinobacterium rhizophilum]UTW14252.1 glycosyltransferase family 2 protein [Marinobacterium rhizophilum]
MSNIVPLISIIVPVYNAEATIHRTIRSCLNQTYDNFELILVDDGSLDSSRSLIRDFIYNSDKVKLVESDYNQGVSSARNRGIHLARGKYLAFLDSDDFWYPRKLEIMVSAIDRFPDFDMFFHDSSVGCEIEEKFFSADFSLDVIPFYQFLIRNPAHTPTVIIRNKNKAEFREDMRYSEDYDLWLRLAFPKGAIKVDQVLAGINRSVGSKGGLSEHKWNMRKGEIKAYARLFRITPLFIFLSPFLILWSLAKHAHANVTRRSGLRRL